MLWVWRVRASRVCQECPGATRFLFIASEREGGCLRVMSASRRYRRPCRRTATAVLASAKRGLRRLRCRVYFRVASLKAPFLGPLRAVELPSNTHNCTPCSGRDFGGMQLTRHFPRPLRTTPAAISTVKGIVVVRPADDLDVSVCLRIIGPLACWLCRRVVLQTPGRHQLLLFKDTDPPLRVASIHPLFTRRTLPTDSIAPARCF
jgi:hypothetical protein